MIVWPAPHCARWQVSNLIVARVFNPCERLSTGYKPVPRASGKANSASIHHVTPRRSNPGTKISATGASAASSGGGIGFRCGVMTSQRFQARMKPDDSVRDLARSWVGLWIGRSLDVFHKNTL